MPSPRPLSISASILAGDHLDLASAIQTAERAGADIISLDICDGHFVPTISFGEEVVRRTCEVARLPVEVHLMVNRPEDWVARLDGCGHFRALFHLEASTRAMGVVNAISANGIKPGVAVNPETPASAIETLLPYIDNVCVLGIAPGFAGQKLLDYTYTKVEAIRRLIEKVAPDVSITVDGGVKTHNARQLVDAGADTLVISSGMYSHKNPEESLNEVRAIVAGKKNPV